MEKYFKALAVLGLFLLIPQAIADCPANNYRTTCTCENGLREHYYSPQDYQEARRDPTSCCYPKRTYNHIPTIKVPQTAFKEPKEEDNLIKERVERIAPPTPPPAVVDKSPRIVAKIKKLKSETPTFSNVIRTEKPRLNLLMIFVEIQDYVYQKFGEFINQRDYNQK